METAARTRDSTGRIQARKGERRIGSHCKEGRKEERKERKKRKEEKEHNEIDLGAMSFNFFRTIGCFLLRRLCKIKGGYLPLSSLRSTPSNEIHEYRLVSFT